MKICFKSVLVIATLLFGFTALSAQSTNCNPKNCKPANCKEKTACCASSSLSAMVASWFSTTPSQEATATATTATSATAACCAKAFAANPNCTPEECAKICAGNPDCDPEECAKFCSAFQKATPDGRATLVSTTIAAAAAYGSDLTPVAKKSCNPAKCKKGKVKANKGEKTSL